jgi:small-conductance mechanosensitive channel
LNAHLPGPFIVRPLRQGRAPERVTLACGKEFGLEISAARAPGTLLIVVAAATAAAWLTGWLIKRIASRRDHSGVVAADELIRTPFVAAVAAVALEAAGQSVPHVAEGWRRAGAIFVIGAVCWLIVRLLNVAQRVTFRRLRVDVADNRRIRRARTQIALLRRVTGAVVVLVGLAAALMTFPGLRTFGASLLASAGLAGILAGLAAQTTLSNVFAGLQLAFTDAVRMDDVVVVEEEWGRIEELTLTYVVVHLWDERRLVLPTSYFTTTPFQNWTRTEARVLGAVVLNLDYATPLTALREKAGEVIQGSPLWDGKDWVLQVVDTTETAMVVRILASAYDAPSSWDLRCDIREAMLTYLQETHPQALPVRRIITQRDGLVPASAEPGFEDGFAGDVGNGYREPNSVTGPNPSESDAEPATRQHVFS